MNKETTRIKQELSAGRPVISFTSGASMEPLLHDRKKKNATHVLIVPIQETCRVGDILLVYAEDGKYILHRLIQVDSKEGRVFYRTRGDHCIGNEYVPQEAVLGVVREIYYKNKTVKVTDKNYQRYVKVWMKIYPLRKAAMQCRIKAGRIYRKCKTIIKK